MNLVTVADLIDQGAAELITGPFGTQLAAHEYVAKGTPVINVRNVGFGDVRTADLEYLDDQTVERLARHRLKEGDIVFGRKGAVERHAFISSDENGWIQGSDCIRLRLDPDAMEPRFVSFAFRTEWHKRWMQNHCSSGATMASLNQDILRLLEIPSPPLIQQHQISELLGAFDDLIKSNRRRIEILEEMARLIYREWFVCFRFPGHEEAELVDSNLGSIPEGWQAVTLGDIASYISRGIAPKYDEGSPSLVINQRCIRDHRLSLDVARRHIKKVPDEKFVRLGDLLVNSTGVGTLGRVAPVRVELDDTTVDSHVTIVRPSAGININYFAELVLYLEPLFESMGVGSTGQTELSRARVGEAEVVVAPKPVRDSYGDLVSPMSQLAVTLSRQNEMLAEARDLLLPRLISGELDVSDLDLNVEPVA